MTALVKAADCAYPFDYSILPADVTVILGYVGGYGNTPHIWSTQEVQTARNSGRIWCPIWVPPQRGLTGTDGTNAAAGMVAALAQYGHPAYLPVFLDIEKGSYDASPAGANAAVRAWQNGMANHGWHTAIAYLPIEANTGWIADWTGIEPAALPVGWRGEQYAGNMGQGRYDLSAFMADVFSTPVGEDFMTLFDGHVLSAAEQAQLDRLGQFIETHTYRGVRPFMLDPAEHDASGNALIDPVTKKPYGSHSIVTLCERAVAAMLAKHGPVTPGGTLDVAALAHELAGQLGFTVTAMVASHAPALPPVKVS